MTEGSGDGCSTGEIPASQSSLLLEVMGQLLFASLESANEKLILGPT